MTPEVVLDLIREAFFIIVLCVAAIVVPSLVVGLIVSMFQAATQINEQTLSFLPRLVITLLTVIVISPRLVQGIVDYTTRLITNIPNIIG